MPYQHSRYLERFAGRPLAISQEMGDILTSLMSGEPSNEDIAESLNSLSARDTSSDAKPGSMVALIPIHGLLLHRGNAFMDLIGGTSYEAIGRALRQVMANPDVGSILLDMNTPGGTVDGLPELGEQIAAASQVKPVVAHVNTMAASAGYWLASQASRVVVTPSGTVGSIGVFTVVMDRTEQLAKAGVKVHVIKAGENKTEGAAFQALSDDARAHLQEMVDASNNDFVAAVSRGRGVSADVVNSTFGQGRMFNAEMALARGMVDDIATIEDTIARVVESTASAASSSTRRAEAESLTVAETPEGVDESPTQDELDEEILVAMLSADLTT